MVEVEATPVIDGFVLSGGECSGLGREVVQETGLGRLGGVDQGRES